MVIGEFLDAVQVPYIYWWCERYGAVAQLGERLLCKEEVRGSSPLSSTNPVLPCVACGSYPFIFETDELDE